jgi:hypothetical protein
LRDVLRHVAHPLERGADSQSAHHDTQVAGDGLLPSKDVDGELIECDSRCVDPVVGGDDGLGEGHVGLIESASGVVDRVLYESRDLH